MNQHPSIDMLKKHYPSCSRIFDQIKETKDDEAKYKAMREAAEQKKA